jgi:hypothetical protein
VKEGTAAQLSQRGDGLSGQREPSPERVGERGGERQRGERRGEGQTVERRDTLIEGVDR